MAREVALPMNPLALWRALRPQQWSKNVFVLAALVFAAADQGHHVAGVDVVRVVFAFAAFCLASSAVYLVNDLIDVEKDRAHPEKRKRPIASGELPASIAMSSAGVLGVLALVLALLSGKAGGVAVVVLAYMVLNLAYTLRLKSIVLVDAFCIATGFLLRVEAGGLAAQAEISHWAYLVTLFLALFLALNKRRAEMMLLGENHAEHRPSLSDYSIGFLDQMTGVLAAVTIVAYTMYTVDPDTARKFGEGHRLIWTVPFVTFGIGRYMVLVQSGKGGDSPTKVFLGGDLWFLINTLAWVGTVVLALFGPR